MAAAVSALMTPVGRPGVWIVNEDPLTTVTVPEAEPRRTTLDDGLIALLLDIAVAGPAEHSMQASAQQAMTIRFTVSPFTAKRPLALIGTHTH